MTMFQLVLDHNYETGEARDSSGHGNDGDLRGPIRMAGIPPDLTALYFNGTSDRIVIFPSDTLNDLGALRISALIWLEELGQRRNIVEGFVSFALIIESDGSLQAKMYNGVKWNGIWTPPNSVPLQKWLRVTFVYNGFDTAVLYINSTLVARRYDDFGFVRGIQWPFGLNIGAWPDADSYVFKGKIAEVKLWRRETIV